MCGIDFSQEKEERKMAFKESISFIKQEVFPVMQVEIKVIS
jgi:hypothetical protein